MKRRLWNLIALTSLLVAIVAVTIWIRSHFRADVINIPTGQDSLGHSWIELISNEGVLYWSRGKNLRDIPQPQHPGGQWDWSSIPTIPTVRQEFRELAKFFHGSEIAGIAWFVDSLSPMQGGWRQTGWRLAIPDAWLLACSSVLPAAWVAQRMFRRRRRLKGICPQCGYDLRATPDRCPECGTQQIKIN